MEPMLADELRRRAAMFWGRHIVIGSWPINPKGRTFMGRAVHMIGRALFDGWVGSEPSFAHYPALDGQRKYLADRFDGAFASWVVGEFDPTVPPDFAQIAQERWTRNRDPLTDEQWHKAIEIFTNRLAGYHRVATHRMITVVTVMTEALAQEKLHAETMDAAGRMSPTAAETWNAKTAFSRFNECQMNPERPDIFLVPDLWDVAMPSALPPDLLPGNAWIYIRNDSLENYLQEMGAAKHQPAQVATTTAVRFPIEDDGECSVVGPLPAAVSSRVAYTEEPVRNAILELVRLYLDGKGRQYGRERLWDIWKADDGLFPGLTWDVFYSAWQATTDDRPPGWGPGRPPRENDALPDSARLIRRI